jgi:hypothetical protein
MVIVKGYDNILAQVETLHAVEGNPPNTDTGLVGAVGHIHFI